MNIRHYAALLLTFALLLAACGDSSGGDPFAEAINDASGGQSSGNDLLEEAIKGAIEDGENGDEGSFADAYSEALGAGGSGNITVDGVDYPIGSVFCLLDPTVDLGTVDEAGWRLLISEVSTGWSVQVLDPEFIQWFSTDNVVEQNGSSFRGADTYWRNGSDDTLEVTYEVTCP